MGDEDVAEALPGPGRFEGGAVETVRDQPADDPPLDRGRGAGQGSGDGGARYSPRPRQPHKLDPYKGIIDARLAEFPRLSAQRLFDEVRAAGYAGGYSRVRDYVREARPGEPDEPAVRVPHMSKSSALGLCAVR